VAIHALKISKNILTAIWKENQTLIRGGSGPAGQYPVLRRELPQFWGGVFLVRGCGAPHSTWNLPRTPAFALDRGFRPEISMAGSEA